ncbi:MAG: nuclear transport factor 2 family protein [Calditrichia bacterium]
MKVLLSVLFAGLLFMAFTDSAETKADEAAIRVAVLDYVEGIYEVQPERIDHGIDVTMRKYGFGFNSRENTYYGAREMNFKQLRNLAANWNKDGSRADAKTSPKEVVIFDQLEKIASAKLVAEWGVDYFHLVKEEGSWKILNVVWQSHRPKAE